MSTSKGVLATRRCWLIYLLTATLLLLFAVALVSSRCCGFQVGSRPRPTPLRHLSHDLEGQISTTTGSSSADPIASSTHGSCDVRNCTVTCVDVDDIASELEAALSRSVEKNWSCLWKVNLTACSFSGGNVLRSGWLPPTISKVDVVNLASCHIDTIADDAFEGPQFANTSILAIQNAKAKSLSRATLAPLVSLNRLELRDFSRLKSVEDGAVSQLPYLEELQLQQMPLASSEFWANTTGGDNVLSKVKTLDLSLNDIGNLSTDPLAGVVTSAEQIFLSDTKLESLEGVGFRERFQNLRVLYLKYNSLTLIPIGVVQQKTYMNLDGNPWNCSCPLDWVQHYYGQIMDAPKCETPLELKGKNIRELKVEDICDNGSDTSPSSPPHSTSMSTPPPDYTSDRPSSSTASPPPTPPTTSVCTQRTPKEEEDEMATTSELEFMLTEVNSYSVRLQVGPRFLNGTLVWVTYDNGSLVCFQHGPIRTASLVVEGLCPESSYSFCFSSGDPMQRFDPVDCVAHKTSALYENQSWIPNNKKNLVLGVGSASAITTCVFIALGVFFALRRNPKLISKNVIVVKEFKDHILVMPKNYVPAADRKRPSQQSSSTTTTSESSQSSVSTVQQHKTKRQTIVRKPPIKPRIASPPPRVDPVVLKSARTGFGGSHNPTPRSSVSYVSVQEPTGAQKVGWRLRKAKHRIRTFFKGKPYNKLHNMEILLEATQPKSSYTLV